MRFAILLFLAAQKLAYTARRYPKFKKRIKEQDLIIQFKAFEEQTGRTIIFQDGKISSSSGLHSNPDITVGFKNEKVAVELLTPPQDRRKLVEAMKRFDMTGTGPDPLMSWFLETMSMMENINLSFGTPQANGETRYTTNTNGGPLFVYVKDNKIVRTTPIMFDGSDADSWQIKARDQVFTPPRQSNPAPHALVTKSLVYSKDRLLYPMKRVDFDPEGERNPEKRGRSEYERISWDAALDIVAGEIKRSKSKYGPGAIAMSHGSHHSWGNVGYYMSALYRFMNAIGHTKVMFNPDSWEGWYWGAMHHFGNSMSFGGADSFGTVEDCLQNAEMIVFWSSDPESTSVYGGHDNTVRRIWAKKLGIKMVHIDPYRNYTANLYGGKWLAPKPQTCPALAQAIAYVWIKEELYDKYYIENRTTGFAEWKQHILGEDGTPAKTPEWQEQETGIPARDVRALAREWGSKRTYLSAGGMGGCLGGACRNSTGTQWARMMAILSAMQGFGRPGVNLGSLMLGAPVDYSFYFPGYGEGGITGDVFSTGAAQSHYTRMPVLPSMNSIKQIIPRQALPEAIMNGECEGYMTEPFSVHSQFLPVKYPLPGHSPVKMFYKYGNSFIGTMSETNRWVKMYQSPNLDFVVNQSIWFEGESKFADIVLPACTHFERYDICEVANAGGYAPELPSVNNHRTIVFQHKCIEPLGESKSDYQIFADLSKRLGLGAYFTEGCTELDWCKRIFDSSDLPKHISWKKFIKKGYFVVPAATEQTKAATAYRWFYEGRQKDLPSTAPLPSEYSGDFLHGLQTQSGKFEFVPETLKRMDDPERPALNRYQRSWQNSDAEVNAKYPLTMVTPHSRYSFHTQSDGKNSMIYDIADHRVEIDGYYYWVLRINQADAAKRNIENNDLVRVFNERGEVICAAQVTPRIREGVLHSYESCAIYDPIGKPGESADRGGCINLLSSKRPQSKKTSAAAASSKRVEVEKWKMAEEAAM